MWKYNPVSPPGSLLPVFVAFGQHYVRPWKGTLGDRKYPFNANGYSGQSSAEIGSANVKKKGRSCFYCCVDDHCVGIRDAMWAWQPCWLARSVSSQLECKNNLPVDFQNKISDMRLNSYVILFTLTDNSCDKNMSHWNTTRQLFVLTTGYYMK